MPNNRASKYMKQQLSELQGDVGDFSVSRWLMGRFSRHTADTREHGAVDLRDPQRRTTRHQNTHSPQGHTGQLPRKTVLSHETSPKKCKWFHSDTFCYVRGQKQTSGKPPDIWKLNITLLILQSSTLRFFPPLVMRKIEEFEINCTFKFWVRYIILCDKI